VKTDSKKTKARIVALKGLGDLSDKEARVLAKRAKVVRVRRRRLLLCGPKKAILASLVLTDNLLTLTLPQGVQVLQNGNVLTLKMPPPLNGLAGKKPKKKEVDTEKDGK